MGLKVMPMLLTKGTVLIAETIDVLVSCWAL